MSDERKGAWWTAGLLVLALGVGLFFHDLGGMALSDRDEGEYAAAAMAMRQSGDYVVPTLNGQPYLEKPILVYWALAGAEALVGPGELAARLPSALAAALLMLLTGATVLLASGSLAWAVLAMGSLGFGGLYLLVARACLTDMLLALFVSASLFAFHAASEREAPRDRAWWLLAWAALGLAFLTKGPVAPALVLPTALAYALWRGGFLSLLRRARIGWGLLIFLVINLPWYGVAFWRLGDRFWQAFFVSQNLRRFSEVLLGHGGGAFFYLPVLLLGLFPFFPAALTALGTALARNPLARRRAGAAGPLPGQGLGPETDPELAAAAPGDSSPEREVRGARLRLLAALASLVAILIFSLAATKQINYLLPALPCLAILAGEQLWRLGRGELPGRLARWVLHGGLWLAAGIWALAGLALLVLPIFWDRVQATIRPDSSEYALPPEAPWLLLWPLGIMAVLAGLVLGWRWLWRSQRAAWSGWLLLAGGALFSGLLLLGLLPQVANQLQEPAKSLAREVCGRAGEGSQVVTFGLWKPSLIYYLGREVPRVRSDEAPKLVERLAGERPVWVLSRASLVEALVSLPGFVRIEQREGYLLGGNQAAARLWEEAPPPGGKAEHP